MNNTAIIGSQWGDEGKGKIIDLLSEKFNTIVRFAGGDNAGHTIVVKSNKHVFHLLPSAILRTNKLCVIGNGVVINPKKLLTELNQLKQSNIKTAKLLISEKCHLILPKHIAEDKKKGGKIGTTARGIGPTYTDAVARKGVRIMDLLESKSFRPKIYLEYLKLLQAHPRVTIGDCSQLLNKLQQKNSPILFEGAQATLLDIYHGTYPYVTSSHPTIGGIFTGTGFRPRNLHMIGVAKAYTTRVGKGPFPTELKGKFGSKLRDLGGEYGSTTGRPRRCGWLDLTILRYAKIINGLDALTVTKLDVLDKLKEIKVCTSYKLGSKTLKVFPTNLNTLAKVKPIYQTIKGWQTDTTSIRKFSNLPTTAKKYLNLIQKQTGLPISYIGVGPDRSQTIKN